MSEYDRLLEIIREQREESRTENRALRESVTKMSDNLAKFTELALRIEERSSGHDEFKQETKDQIKAINKELTNVKTAMIKPVAFTNGGLKIVEKVITYMVLGVVAWMSIFKNP
ncbi:hypothetical protein [Alteromonas mediterranea]|uniref:Uncharacterized protein n=1 Tax=Alteromonas mediterranea (strain DSM 17117 / CIP 110805 / LMG 28347 / Deep ecotype) TaxID=1774373 RepID=F2GC80_ALTMD|nr:hypothetical protein [Alteromonas mediterranea]AEA99036.1 hypothetical protein MADE_1014510 [Alteromonas mediterranea DE]